MRLTNVRLFCLDHSFRKLDLCITGERISAIHEPADVDYSTSPKAFNGKGLFCIPGLVDIHMHGAMGKDFCDASEESLKVIAEYEASKGVLAICPATMTYSEEILNAIIDTATAHRNTSGADIVGINMEGPFISPNKAGAQNPKYISACDDEMFLRLFKRSKGLIKLVDIAPEEPGALNFIQKHGQNVRVSLAHTGADYDTALAAFRNGALHMTHLFNAMPGLHHRNPGPIVAAKEMGADVELISDGLHCHPAIIRFTFNVFGSEKVVLISDSTMACGLADGQYLLGGQSVTLKDSKCTLTEHPDTLAGSAACLYDCMKNAIEYGVPAADAIRAASENPARCIGVEKDYGSLSQGSIANAVLVDSDFNIHAIIRHGEFISGMYSR